MTHPPGRGRLHLAVGLASVSLIGYQLVLMQLLSLAQWHHFAFMVISVALLGFGASGTAIALFREALLRRLTILLPLLLLASAAAMAAAAGAAQHLFGGFDTFLLFVEPRQTGYLLATTLIFFVPFFLGALAIGLVFVREAERIGTFYFANLLGSALGGLAAVALMDWLLPRRLPAAVALFILAAGWSLLPRRRSAAAAALVATVTVLALLAAPPGPVLSEYKDLSRALDLPGAKVLASRPSPHGLVQVVTAPALRPAPGLSLTYAGQVAQRPVVFVNGNGFGPLPVPPQEEGESLLDYTTGALPYALGERRRVLVLPSGTGEEAAQALAHGARQIIAVEPVRAVPELLAGRFPKTYQAVFGNPRVRLSFLEPRTWLAADAARYDLIALPTVGTFGGTSGLFALQEEYLLTLDAFRALWEHLSPEGVIRVSAWLDQPPRSPLKLAATMGEMLEEQGLDPASHVAAVRGWGTITFVIKRTPLSPADIEAIRAFGRRLQFDPALLPGLSPEEAGRFHRLQEPQLLADLERALLPGRDELLRRYPFMIRPATDDRPFFYRFLRWRSLPLLTDLFGRRAVPFLEMGYFIVLVTFIELALAGVMLILLPLFRLGWRGGGKLGTLGYFGGLGLGYMFFEMVLIHQLVLYLGQPIYAAAAAIAALLIFSGGGSLCSVLLSRRPVWPARAAGLAAALLFLYAFLLPPLLHRTIALPLTWKALFALLLLAPPAFVMGFPFPLGLRLLSDRDPAQVPWAWGINGCVSVLSTALATLAAVAVGLRMVMLAAAAAYLAATLAVALWRRQKMS